MRAQLMPQVSITCFGHHGQGITDEEAREQCIGSIQLLGDAILGIL